MSRSVSSTRKIKPAIRLDKHIKMLGERKCFIIQPLDEAYKDRCDETYKPAIANAGLLPYRVDEHFDAHTLIIQKICKEIEDSDVCLAEITEDNPNVWYEYGFADGCGIPVVLICEDGKRDKLPFDVNQRNVYFYKTDSQGDWEQLQKEITRRLEIAIQSVSAKKVNRDVVESEDSNRVHFGEAELCMLKILYYDLRENRHQASRRGSRYVEARSSRSIQEKLSLRSMMEGNGFSSMDITDAVNLLETLEMMKYGAMIDHPDPKPFSPRLTKKGSKWCIENKELLRQVGK